MIERRGETTDRMIEEVQYLKCLSLSRSGSFVALAEWYSASTNTIILIADLFWDELPMPI